MEINDAAAVALIGLLGGAATAPAKGLADYFTMVWPGRPTWAAGLFAMAVGIALVFLVAVAYGVSLTTQTGAMCVLAGIGAGLAASGITSTGNTAEAKRAEAQAPTPPPSHF